MYRSKYEPVTKASHLNIPMEVDVVGAGSSLYKLMELGTINETYLDAIAFKIFPKESEKYPPEKRNSVALMKK